MAKPFSIRGPLQGELFDFLKSSGFDCNHLTELARDLTCLLASYREEDVPLFPDVFILSNPEALAPLCPGTQPVRIGTGSLNTSAVRVLKDCAPLAVKGWSVYVAKTGENSAEFGLFRSLIHCFATTAEEAMLERRGEPQAAAVLIRNRGHLVVELCNAKSDILTVSFTSAPASDSQFTKHLHSFSSVVTSNVSQDNRETFHPYLIRLLTDVLQHCHGTLMAVSVPLGDGKAPPGLEDGVWLPNPIDLAAAHNIAAHVRDAASLAALQADEALLSGMIGSDGVVIFGTNGTILGYRIFLKPNDDEKKVLPDRGGGRRRTFALLQHRLGPTLKAAFIRSQDGDTESAVAINHD